MRVTGQQAFLGQRIAVAVTAFCCTATLQRQSPAAVAQRASSGCCGYTDSAQAIDVADGGIVVAGFGKATSDGVNAFGIARMLLDLVFADRFE